MSRVARPVLALLALLVTAVSVAQPVPQAPAKRASQTPPPAKPSPTDRAVPFRVGESLAYDVSWSSFLTAGAALLTVRERRAAGGATAWHIVAEGRATGLVARLYHVYYKTDTDLDTRTILPHRASLYREEGRRRRTTETRFDRKARRVHFQTTGHAEERSDLPMPPDAHDPLSALFAMRSLPLRPNAAVTMSVASNGKLYRVRVTVQGRETIGTPSGPRAAWRVNPVIQQLEADGGEPRAIALWLSDDARRLPLRLEAEMPVGSFHLVLREAGGTGGND